MLRFSPRRPRGAPVVAGLITATLALAAGVSTILYSNRIELFVLPASWREVARLGRFGEDDEISGWLQSALYARADILVEDVDDYVAESRFSAALISHLALAAADPFDFERADAEPVVQFVQRIDALDGSEYWLVCFQTSGESLGPGPNRRKLTYAGVHRLLDAAGRLVEIEPFLSDDALDSYIFFGCTEDRGHEPLPRSGVSALAYTGSEWDDIALATIDERGFVDLGPVAQDHYSTPYFAELTDGLVEGASELDPETIGFLDSLSTGDVLRGLSAIGKSGRERHRARRHLGHRSALVRAIAYAMLGPSLATKDELLGAALDPDARVRFSALTVAIDSDMRSADEIVRAFTRDSEAEIRNSARFHLTASSRSDSERRSCLTALLRAREPRAIELIRPERSSGAAVRAFLEWLEDDLPAGLSQDYDSPAFHLAQSGLPVFDLNHLTGEMPRLLALVQSTPNGPVRDAVIITLARLGAPEAVAVVAERILADQEVPMNRLQNPFPITELLRALASETRTRCPPELIPLLRRWTKCRSRVLAIHAAAVLAARAEPGAREHLFSLLELGFREWEGRALFPLISRAEIACELLRRENERSRLALAPYMNHWREKPEDDSRGWRTERPAIHFVLSGWAESGADVPSCAVSELEWIVQQRGDTKLGRRAARCVQALRAAAARRPPTVAANPPR